MSEASKIISKSLLLKKKNKTGQFYHRYGKASFSLCMNLTTDNVCMMHKFSRYFFFLNKKQYLLYTNLSSPVVMSVFEK